MGAGNLPSGIAAFALSQRQHGLRQSNLERCTQEAQIQRQRLLRAPAAEHEVDIGCRAGNGHMHMQLAAHAADIVAMQQKRRQDLLRILALCCIKERQQRKIET